QTVLPLEIVVEKLTAGKAIFGIEDKGIAEGAEAGFTLFTADGSYTFGKNDIKSKSKNSAFLGINLKGKAYGIYSRGKLILNQ
ncbi:MAG TPA: dihydroorotase, partial [Flavobacterium sp.]|nr:dihydroorotase [Flavobacterium sp.]